MEKEINREIDSASQAHFSERREWRREGGNSESRIITQARPKTPSLGASRASPFVLPAEINVETMSLTETQHENFSFLLAYRRCPRSRPIPLGSRASGRRAWTCRRDRGRPRHRDRRSEGCCGGIPRRRRRQRSSRWDVSFLRDEEKETRENFSVRPHEWRYSTAVPVQCTGYCSATKEPCTDSSKSHFSFTHNSYVLKGWARKPLPHE